MDNENKEKFYLVLNVLEIYHQNLKTIIKRNVWEEVRRIYTYAYILQMTITEFY